MRGVEKTPAPIRVSDAHGYDHASRPRQGKAIDFPQSIS
jgi:hypothetical protein